MGTRRMGITVEKRKQLIQALDFAGRTGSFCKRNVIENAENVCVFGLGKYFEDAFIRQNVRERFRVTMLCDNNRLRLREVAADKRYSGLQCVLPEDIPDNTVIIVMLGDPRSVFKQLKMNRNISLSTENYMNLLTYNDVALDDIMGGEHENDWFLEHKPDILRVFDMLHDDESRRVYVNVLCNRIAPQYSQYGYEELCTLPQYFPKDLFTLEADEAFVDCGAYTGDTIASLLEVTGGQFERIDAFELDAENFQGMMERVAKLDKNISSRIRLWNGGVAEFDGLVPYGRMSSADSYSMYNPRDVATAKVFSLDNALGKEKVTMIKMDIEGAELSALKGATAIIQVQRPKIAACIYHRIEDMWQIPLFLKELVPEYKIGIRHHAEYWVSETVCYAYL